MKGIVIVSAFTGNSTIYHVSEETRFALEEVSVNTKQSAFDLAKNESKRSCAWLYIDVNQTYLEDNISAGDIVSLILQNCIGA